MTDEPEELTAQAKQITAHVAGLIEALAPGCVATLAMAPAITSTAAASRILSKMAKQALPMAKMAAQGIIRSGPNISEHARQR
jgi:hypothetical protein